MRYPFISPHLVPDPLPQPSLLCSTLFISEVIDMVPEEDLTQSKPHSLPFPNPYPRTLTLMQILIRILTLTLATNSVSLVPIKPSYKAASNHTLYNTYME